MGSARGEGLKMYSIVASLLSASIKAEGRALKLKLCLQTVVKSISKVQAPHIKVMRLNIIANDAAV